MPQTFAELTSSLRGYKAHFLIKHSASNRMIEMASNAPPSASLLKAVKDQQAAFEAQYKKLYDCYNEIIDRPDAQANLDVWTGELGSYDRKFCDTNVKLLDIIANFEAALSPPPHPQPRPHQADRQEQCQKPTHR